MYNLHLFGNRIIIGTLKNYFLNKQGGELTMAQVNKDTMIGELLNIDQNVAPLLLNIGMHCLGCPSSQMETIGEAAMVHGYDPDALVNEINNFLAKSE